MASALQTMITGMSGLQAYWPLEGASGADLGPNSQPLTLSSGCTAAASGSLVLGGGVPTVFDGTTNAHATTGALLTGSPLNFSGPFTIACWMQAPTALTAGNCYVFTRGNGTEWCIEHTGAHKVSAWGGYTTRGGLVATGGETLQVGPVYMVALVFDGAEQFIYLNGLFMRQTVVGPYQVLQGTDAINLSFGGGSYWNGYLGHLAVWNRALTGADIRKMWLTGYAGTPPSFENPHDLACDDLPAVGLSGAPVTGYCAGPTCGGMIRSNEPVISTSPGVVWHRDCYAIRPPTISQPWIGTATSSTYNAGTNSSTADVIRATARLMSDVRRKVISRQVDTGWLSYYSRTNPQVPTGSSGTFGTNPFTFASGNFTSAWRDMGALATSCAVLQRYYRLPRHCGTRRFAQDYIDWCIQNQQVAAGTITGTGGSALDMGGSFGVVGIGDSFFFGIDFVQCAYLLWPYLDQAHRTSWMTSLQNFGAFWIRVQANNPLPPTWNGNQFTFYINGNQQIMPCLIAYLMGKLNVPVPAGAPFKSWSEAYEALFTWLNTPSSTAVTAYGKPLSAYGFVDPTAGNNAVGMGWYQVTAPTLDDASDGKGYFAEKPPNTTGAPPPGTGGAIGFDPDYTTFQLEMCQWMWVWTQDRRWLRLMNQLYNQLLPLIDQSGATLGVGVWGINASGGSRHNVPAESFMNTAPITMWIQNLRQTNPVTTAMVQPLWSQIESQMRANLVAAPNSTLCRFTGGGLSPVLMSDPNFNPLGQA